MGLFYFRLGINRGSSSSSHREPVQEEGKQDMMRGIKRAQEQTLQDPYSLKISQNDPKWDKEDP